MNTEILSRNHELVKLVHNQKNEKLINLVESEEIVQLDELYKLRDLINKKLYKYTGGSSIENQGVNFNFTWNGKPFFMRIEIDEYHYKIWKEHGIIK